MIAFWILFIISFAGTIYAIPHSVSKLSEKGYVAKDMYKPDKRLIPTNAGMIVLFTSFISIALLPLILGILNQSLALEESISDLSMTNLAFLLVISIYAIYGLIDDLLDIGRVSKLLLPVAFGYPLISVIRPETVWIPILGDFDLEAIAIADVTWGILFRAAIIPVYVMVVSNLVNMHSGYNGLQSGLSVILISTLLFKSWSDGTLEMVLPAGAFLGALIALWWFNKYPARIFEGNIGSLMFGSVIGCLIVIQQYWWLGFFILIPHTFNFILWIIWLALIRKNPEIYLAKDGKHKKFGKIREDHTIKVPNRLSLKWIPNYYIRLNESQSTIISLSITIVFCLAGLVLF